MRHFYKVVFTVLCIILMIAGYHFNRNADGKGYSGTSTHAFFEGDTAHGLIGRYYNDVAGSDFDTLKLARVDSVIQFDWGDGSPQQGVIQNNDFSVRWLGLIYAPKTGTYKFHTWTDDGARLYINGQKVIDYWGSCCSDHSGEIDLVAGKLYPIILEMHEGGGGASAKYLNWEVPDGDNVLVSSRYLYAVVPQTVARPALIPKPHLYEGVAPVRVHSPTPDAIVHYTLDGSDPTPESPVYTENSTILITSTSTLKVRAFKNGMYPSDIVSGTYKIIPPLVSTPVFSPTEGVYRHPQEVALTTEEEGTTIYYTLDGSNPTTASTQYTGPVEIDSTTRIKAYAVKEGRTPSKIASATFTILPTAADAPAFNIPAGDYKEPQTITITSSTTGAVIHYALDDEVLNEASAIYSTPLTINKTTTLKAYAEKEGLNASDVTIATYVIGGDKDTVSVPEFSSPGGHYNSTIRVSLFTDTKNATIYYTTDGTEPDVRSINYYAPILIEDSMVVKAYAVSEGMVPSPVVSATYVVKDLNKDTSIISSKLPDPKLTISPNPATDQVRISWENLIYTLDGTYITVTDSKGVVMKRVVVKGGYTYYVMNTAQFADGVYFVKVQSGNAVILGKIIINR